MNTRPRKPVRQMRRTSTANSLHRVKAASDPQKVINSCEAHWDAFRSDCSGFVKAVAADFGITLTGQADDIVDQIQGPGWRIAADGTGRREHSKSSSPRQAAFSERTSSSPGHDRGRVSIR